MKAAHIVPHKLGGLTMRLLFGKDEDSRGYTTIRHGLLLHPTVRSFFDDGSITIVPASDPPDETALVVRVLEQDEEWLDKDSDRLPLSQDAGQVIKNRGLHEGRLVFVNASRPAKRFLDFKYCIALYKAQTEKRQAGLHSEIARSRRVWATTGMMMRKNMLRALAATLGHGLASLLHVEANSAAGDPAESRAEKVQAYNEL